MNFVGQKDEQTQMKATAKKGTPWRTERRSAAVAEGKDRKMIRQITACVASACATAGKRALNFLC